MSYHAYAGIGSRQTPRHILNIMDHIACYLFSQGWTLRSGGAEGADTAFEQAVDRMHYAEQEQRAVDILIHMKEIYLPWKGFNNSNSALHPIAIPFSNQEMELSASMHPAWDKCSPSAKLLHQRNLRQIIGCEAVNGPKVTTSKFVVCWTEGGQLKGGTAQALRIAKACEIPIINLGAAQNAKELENLVLAIDTLQAEAKLEAIVS